MSFRKVITAVGIKDSLGYQQRPVLTQEGQESKHDSVKLNYNTEKLIAWNTDSKLDELFTLWTIISINKDFFM